MDTNNSSQKASILFYDGVCGLCQRSVYFLYKIDSQEKLKYAPLNGLTYKSYNFNESPMDTVVFFHAGKVYKKSQAIIETASYLGGWKKLLLLLYIIPEFFRDWAYEKIANNRKKVSCIILPKDTRFLP
ncbi:MAG: DUF393 domain-containing protein [Bacteriovoracaceae bacterium]|nr:DUF393 domain-containing protein [Bacteriovoracaceae bacterium]